MNKDIFVKICDFLCDYDRLNFVSVTEQFNKLIQYIYFDEKISIDKITHLSYFDRFTNITMANITMANFIKKIPKHLIKLQLYSYMLCTFGKLPITLRYLTLDYYCNEDLLRNIPNTITHLNIYIKITKNIKKCLPESITHLHIDDFDTRVDLKKYIPQNVTNLTFGYRDKPNITSACIPKTAKHLKFLGPIYHKIDIPYGVTHLTFGNTLRENIDIPTSVTHLYLHICDNNLRIPNSVLYLSLFDKHTNVPNSVIDLLYVGHFLVDGAWIPSSVKHIEFTQTYRRQYIPASVTHLTLPTYSKDYSLRKIPLHVEHITYRHCSITNYCDDFDSIPTHIKSLTIGRFKVDIR
uniref:F-box and FNIP repeat-containing protein n=1 Tax=viral metagenome TaxID=1070528 RepID=A0A6C0C7F9_9ZZZZ